MPPEPPTAERARVLAGFGQMLMLIDRWRDSHRVCEEAIAIARQVGARGAEGHALNTFGLDLMALGQLDEGAAALEQASRSPSTYATSTTSGGRTSTSRTRGSSVAIAHAQPT